MTKNYYKATFSNTVLFALKSFYDRLEGWHINLMIDNTTAVEAVI